MDVVKDTETINMSKKYNQWYAMRKNLQDKGKWKGAAHKVPAREEGEPEPKNPKFGDPLENQEAAVQEGATPDPEEGTSKTAQGMLLI